MAEETVVGAFRLLEEVGRGGMGVVWRAEHLHQGVPAAIKFITAKRYHEQRFKSHFRNEVETMAALHHPSIAMVFDYGEETGRLTSHGISEGSPYLAMEWAARGTLADLVPIATWEEVRRFVLDLLDGLSHAHARGVIHRDLKPQNLLVSNAGRLKISDFGLAFRAVPGEQAQSIGTAGGTPRWMAPEQIRGTALDQGPWTDLYALGCIVFWLLTYRPPYHTGDVDDILRCHLEEPIPRLKSRIPIPHNIESWLRRLLAKDPNDRYRYAADAAQDLRDLPFDISAALDDQLVTSELAPHPDDLLDTELFGEEIGLDEPSSYAAFETSAMPVRLDRRPPPRRDWAREEAPDTPVTLVGAGLGLWGLREIPLVDREAERDVLWQALRSVHRGGARAIVLRGAPGTGKSRLARWLCERALEEGAAHVCIGRHGAQNTGDEGLAEAVTGWFRAHGLDAATARARIQAEFDALQIDDEHLDVLALGELVESTSELVTADSRERSTAAWLRYLERATADRPMVMWFDDVQWGPQTLGFVAQVMENASALPIMFVLTARDDILAERPVERARLAGLLESDAIEELVIEPLDETHRVDLIRRLLRLDPSLCEDLAARTQGNPLFAVQLTDDWVQRGILEIDESGFVLARGAEAEVPESIRKVWDNRLERVIARCRSPRRARQTLELAAVLGQNPLQADWEAVCTAADLEADPDVVDSLVREGLARRRPRGWSFSHTLFREAIEATAREHGRAEVWHSYCADHCLATFGLGAENAERHARHLLAAGRVEDALPRLLIAAESHARTGDFDRVEEMFSRYDEALDRLDRDTTKERLRGDLHRVRDALFEARVDELEPLLERAEREIADIQDDELLAEALFVRSRIHRHRGEPEKAVGPAERALELYSGGDNKAQIGLLSRSLGELYRGLGRLKEAKASYLAARKIFGELNDEFQTGWCELGLASTDKQAGSSASYIRHLEAAALAFEHSRSYRALGCAYNEKGEWLRLQGRLDEALEAYTEALRFLPASHSEVGIAEFNMGLTEIAREQWESARRCLRRASDSFDRQGRSGAKTYVELATAVCAAGQKRWEELEILLERVLDPLQTRGFSNVDVASLLQLAGDLCNRAAEQDRSRRLWMLARGHWEKLGRTDEVELLDQKLGALPA